MVTCGKPCSFSLQMLLISSFAYWRDSFVYAHLQQISKANDVSQFFPDVVKLTARKNFELKRFVYMYLTHYAVGPSLAWLPGIQTDATVAHETLTPTAIFIGFWREVSQFGRAKCESISQWHEKSKRGKWCADPCVVGICACTLLSQTLHTAAVLSAHSRVGAPRSCEFACPGYCPNTIVWAAKNDQRCVRVTLSLSLLLPLLLWVCLGHRACFRFCGDDSCAL